MASKTETLLGLSLLTLVLISLAVFFLFQSGSSSNITTSSEQLKPEWYTLTTARGNELENKSIVGNCHLYHDFWVPIPTNEQTSNPRFAHTTLADVPCLQQAGDRQLYARRHLHGLSSEHERDRALEKSIKRRNH